MLNRRTFLASTATALAAPSLLSAQGRDWAMPENLMPRLVDNVDPSLPAGEIHISQPAYKLYWTLGNGRAVRYSVAVGEEGRQFRGEAVVKRKVEWPSWTPTANMIRRQPELYAEFAGGMEGGPDNPLGARALYLYRGNRDTLYRIHGTPQPWSLGQSVSNGCVRLHNSHVADLYNRVPIGTRVVAYSMEDLDTDDFA